MKSRKITFIPDFPSRSEIPKKIHQTYPIKDLPVALEQNVEYIRTLNPLWEYVLYDDEDIRKFVLVNYGSDIMSVIDRIDPSYGAAKADLFRYLLMYKEGGVYLDIKSTIDKPLDDILTIDDRYILSKWQKSSEEDGVVWGNHKDLPGVVDGEYQQWHIISAPGHPYLRAVIKEVLQNISEYKPWTHKVGRYGVLRTTGPIAYTRAITPIINCYPHRIIASDADFGLRYTIFSDRDHVGIFKKHYSNNHASIVKISGFRRLFAICYSAVRAVKHRFLGGW